MLGKVTAEAWVLNFMLLSVSVPAVKGSRVMDQCVLPAVSCDTEAYGGDGCLRSFVLFSAFQTAVESDGIFLLISKERHNPKRVYAVILNIVVVYFCSGKTREYI